MGHSVVYYTDIEALKDEVLFGRVYNIVSDDRRKKVDKYRNKKDKMLSLAAELLLRKALVDRSGQFDLCDRLRFRSKENGKPYLDIPENIFFNISHSERYVVCAISDKEIGCDIEHIGNADVRIAERFFSEKEREIIDSQKNDCRSILFYRYWTAKESYLKLTGDGLRAPLDSFTVCLEEGKIEAGDAVYYLREIEIDKSYKTTICTEDRIDSADIIKTDIRALISF